MQAGQLVLDVAGSEVNCTISTSNDKQIDASVSSASNGTMSHTDTKAHEPAKTHGKPGDLAAAFGDRESTAVELLNLHTALDTLKGTLALFQRNLKLQ